MDIYGHVASGAVTGLALGLVPYRGAYLSRRLSVGVCAVGALVPDLDALSHAMGETGRRVYYGKAWYSHHQFTHSLLGCALVAVALALLWHVLRGRRRRARGGTAWPLVAGLLFVGGVVHVLGDLPTPPGPWGGLPLLFPLPLRFGGWDRVWWWHNYYVLFVFGLALAAAAVLGGVELLRPSFGRAARWTQALVAVVALGLVVHYLSQSRFRSTADWYANEARAKEIQRQWVPEPFYSAFLKASDVMPLYL